MSEHSKQPTYDNKKYQNLWERTNLEDFVCLTSDELAALARNLKKLRKSQSRTSREMAEFLDITLAAYSDIERNNRKVDLERQIVILADVLRTTPEYLVGRTTESGPAENTLYRAIRFFPDPDELLHKLYSKDKPAYDALLDGLSLKGKQYSAFREIIIASVNYAKSCPET